MQNQNHILNVYISVTQHTPHVSERMLVIETDLELPQSRFAQCDPRVEDLLLELHELKTQNPALFRSVDTVEIRGTNLHADTLEISEDGAATQVAAPVASKGWVSSSRPQHATTDRPAV
jgi:hypothetical protein